jgi:GR25 family glycosyltransferase involved in LPS biosynthesis
LLSYRWKCLFSFRHLAKDQQRKCSLLMKHVEVWYEMAEKNVSLGLILEDDAIFVPLFKEKLARMINEGIRSGTLRMNGACATPKVQETMVMGERINQDPMFVIGSCENLHGGSFQKQLPHARPVLTSHKSSSSRCTHAYLLTSCSARALVQQIRAQQNEFLPSDFLQNYLVRLSPTLQAFWIDPPLAYQGNQIIDLDNMATFKVQSYG